MTMENKRQIFFGISLLVISRLILGMKIIKKLEKCIIKMGGKSTFFTRSTSLVVINGKYYDDVYFHVIQNDAKSVTSNLLYTTLKNDLYISLNL